MLTSTQRPWLVKLLVICAAALAIRVGYVHVQGIEHIGQIQSDAYYYHLGANLLAEGEGFIHPLFWWDRGLRVEAADHPPGFIALLAAASKLGWDSVRNHMFVASVVGTGTVALVGLLGRHVGGARVGLLAAGLAAVHPNLWMIDGSLMSETLALLLGAAVSLAAYRVWDLPSTRRFSELGLAIGLAALTRAESLLLLPLLVVPLAGWVPRLNGSLDRAKRAAAALAVTIAVMAPWVGHNLARTDGATLVSNGLGGVLAAGTCDSTYSGPFVGFWTFECQLQAQPPGLRLVDWAQGDKLVQQHAFTYMSEHLDKLPSVVLARLGRTWGLYSPIRQLELDRFNDLRPPVPAQIGLGFYYLTAAAGIAGAVVLRRRGIPLLPLTIWIATVSLTVAAFYGQTRFRAPAEPALAVLAAVGLERAGKFGTSCLRPVDLRQGQALIPAQQPEVGRSDRSD